MTHTFRVWAPEASAVDVVIEVTGSEARPHPMRRDGAEGWWTTTVVAAGPGTAYRFSLDGSEPLPDPRSRRQPRGVHGPSQVSDLAGFAWTDAGWPGPDRGSMVVYELHVGTFTPEGTLDAAAHRLDHLVDLGVAVVELMPVASFPGVHGWGYDGVHLWAVHEPYGGPPALQRFVNACHGRGLACILDVVYNHLGPDGSVLARYGPYFTDRHRTPWGDAINVDGRGSDEVRAFIVDNAVGWLEDYHLDGLRLDAVHAIVDTSATHLLEELATRVRALEAQLGRRMVVIAESDLNDPRVVTEPVVGGFGLDAQWSDDFHHALWSVLTGERNGYYEDFGSFDDLAVALRRGVVYDGRHSRHRGRRHGRPYDGVPGTRLLGYLQDHDQVGNRALGERSGQLLDAAALRAAAATVLLGPFTPMLFMGEEWGARTPFQYFTDHIHTAPAAAVSHGRRREFAAFGWEEDQVPDPQERATFERSRLDWSEPAREPHAGLLGWHRDLLRIRRGHPELRDGRLDRVDVAVDGEARSLMMRRGGVVVAWNLGREPVDVPVEATVLDVLLAFGPPGTGSAGTGLHLEPGTTVVARTAGS